MCVLRRAWFARATRTTLYLSFFLSPQLHPRPPVSLAPLAQLASHRIISNQLPFRPTISYPTHKCQSMSAGADIPHSKLAGTSRQQHCAWPIVVVLFHWQKITLFRRRNGSKKKEENKYAKDQDNQHTAKNLPNIFESLPTNIESFDLTYHSGGIYSASENESIRLHAKIRQFERLQRSQNESILSIGLEPIPSNLGHIHSFGTVC